MVHPAAGAATADTPRPPRGCAAAHLPVVAGLWKKLLASPSPRVGRPGTGAATDPVGRPTASPSPDRSVRAPTSADVLPGGRRRRLPGRCHQACTDCGHSCGRNSSGRPQLGTGRGTRGEPAPAGPVDGTRWTHPRGTTEGTGRDTVDGRLHGRPGDGLGADPRAA